MTAWVDFCVYALYLVSVFFVAPRQVSGWNRLVLSERNAAWLAAHPDAPTRYNGSRAYLLWGYLLGALALGALAATQLGMLPPRPRAGGELPLDWQRLWDITSLSSLIAAIWLVGGYVVFGALCLRRVPLAERRRATLEPRSIGDFVPAPVRVVTYALVLATIAAWLAVGALGLYSTPKFWGRVLGILFIAAFFFFMAHVFVNRRPTAFDAVAGPAVRRLEVRFAFAAQLMTPIMGSVRLFEEVTNSIAHDANRAMGLAVATLIAWAFLRSWDGPQTQSSPPICQAADRHPGHGIVETPHSSTQRSLRGES